MDCKMCWVKDNDPRNLHESEYSWSTLMLYPLRPGHMMVLPKRCVKSTRELSAEETKDFLEHVDKLAGIVEKIFGRALVVHQRQHCSQDHMHFQIVPDDKGIRGLIQGSNKPIYPEVSDKEWQEVHKKVKACLKQ